MYAPVSVDIYTNVYVQWIVVCKSIWHISQPQSFQLDQLAGFIEFWQHLSRGVRPLPNECPGYDTKQSEGEVPVMLLAMRSTPSLLSGPIWPGMVAPDRALSVG